MVQCRVVITGSWAPTLGEATNNLLCLHPFGQECYRTGAMWYDRLYLKTSSGGKGIYAALASTGGHTHRFGPARWLDDGTYTTVEPSTSVRGGADIVRYDAATGQRECTSLPRS